MSNVYDPDDLSADAEMPETPLTEIARRLREWPKTKDDSIRWWTLDGPGDEISTHDLRRFGAAYLELRDAAQTVCTLHKRDSIVKLYAVLQRHEDPDWDKTG